MKKRAAICFLLLCYAVAGCGAFLGTCCCHDDSAHHKSEPASHQRFFSKAQVAAHLMSHSQEAANSVQLTVGNRCCISSEAGNQGQPAHTRVRPLELSNLELNTLDTLATCDFYEIHTVSWSWQPFHQSRGMNSYLTDPSVFSTVLLI